MCVFSPLSGSTLARYLAPACTGAFVFFVIDAMAIAFAVVVFALAVLILWLLWLFTRE